MAEAKVKETTWRGSATFTPKTKSSGVWNTFTGIMYTKISGNWVRVWPPGDGSTPALSVSVSPGIDNFVDLTTPYDYDELFTANPLGGDGNYTYAWSFVSNAGAFSFSGGTTGSTATVIKATTSTGIYGCTIQCIVTDNGGAGSSATSNSVIISFTAGTVN